MDKEIISKVTGENGESLIEISNEGINIDGREKKNNKLVDFLNYEESQLIKRIQKARDEENFGTYKNLIQALVNVSELLDKKDWKLNYSEYNADDKKQVAIWEENGEGSIRNHKTWNVNGDERNKPVRIMGLDFELMQGNSADVLSVCIVEVQNNTNKLLYADKVGLHGINKSIVSFIKDKCDRFDVNKIVTDKSNYGILLYEELIHSNLIEKYMKVISVNNIDMLSLGNYGFFFTKDIKYLNDFQELKKQVNNFTFDKNGKCSLINDMSMGLYYALKNIGVYLYSEKIIG